jgi:hypothetical protein
VSEDAGIERRTVATLALTARRSNPKTYLFPEPESLHLLVRVAEGCVAVGRSPQVQVTQLNQVSPYNLPASQPLCTHSRREKGGGDESGNTELKNWVVTAELASSCPEKGGESGRWQMLGN